MSSILQWISNLPDSWEVKPLKSIASYWVSNVDKVPNDEEEPVNLCNYSDVYNNDYITLDLEFMRTTATRGEISKFGLQIGDIIITKDSESWDDIAIPALVIETDERLVCGYHLAMVRPESSMIHSPFLFRCFQSKSLRIQLELASTGVTRYGLPKGEIGNFVLPLPPLQTQRLIAAYLDRETAHIDALIAAKERLLALLAEKRQALITRAVTRGLEKNVKMKNSGVAWLGEVPEGWLIERAKWLFYERNERSVSGEEEMLTVSHITGVTSRSEKDVNMFEAESNEGYKIAHQGDLVINTLWAWMGAMGISPLYGIVSPAYHVYQLSELLDKDYVDAIVRMPIFAAEVTRFSKGVWSSRLRLYPEGLYEVYFPVPPMEEQRLIVDHIKTETSRLDNLQNANERSIALLKERRSALISAAVTGRVEVERAS